MPVVRAVDVAGALHQGRLAGRLQLGVDPLDVRGEERVDATVPAADLRVLAAARRGPDEPDVALVFDVRGPARVARARVRESGPTGEELVVRLLLVLGPSRVERPGLLALVLDRPVAGDDDFSPGKEGMLQVLLEQNGRGW